MSIIQIELLLATIGKNLHSIRNARKETIQSVAFEVGVSHPVISRIENGRYESLQLGLLIKLCNHFKVSLPQILSIETTNIFQLTQHNKDGSQKLIGQEVGSGYELYINQLKEENSYLKNQLQLIIENVSKSKP